MNKDPEPLIPEVAKNLGLENIITDGISGQHPFGAILAAALADKAGVLHTHPVMYFVPKQKDWENTMTIMATSSIYWNMKPKVIKTGLLFHMRMKLPKPTT